jgi:DHA2 family multidrug resistance protein
MPDGAHHEDWHPRHNPWLIAVAVMMAVFMEVLDTSIANIALPHIAGSLSATTDEATWVLTSYLVSNAIILPMTGWLGNYFGRKRVLLSCVAIFTFASVLCGLAWNLPTLILARIFQGIGGGAMVPIAQAVLLESFPMNKRGVAMAAFSMGVIVAPILGPTLGGWITDNYSWRWIFYINVPFGIGAVFLQQWLVEDPPYIKRNEKADIDFIGFGLLAVWLATLQITLDKGQEEDWFQSNWICWFVIISVGSLIGFIAREFTAEHPLVDLRVFKNRNFAVGVLLMLSLAAILYGTTAELPLFLQTLMGYPALQSGYAMSPRGIAAFVTTFFMGRLVGRVRSRWLLCFGFHHAGRVVVHVERHHFAGEPDARHLAEHCQRHRHQFHFRAADHDDHEPVAPAANRQCHRLFNLVRNLGGSIGIAFVTTMLARGAQAHQALMVGHLTPTDPVFGNGWPPRNTRWPGTPTS